MSTALTLAIRDDGYALASWSLASGETGHAAAMGRYPALKTFQLQGTFGGGTVALQGSMDGTNFHTLSTIEIAAGIYVLLTGLNAAQMSSIIENPLYVRPVVTGGDGTTSLQVYVGCATRL